MVQKILYRSLIILKSIEHPKHLINLEHVGSIEVDMIKFIDQHLMFTTFKKLFLDKSQFTIKQKNLKTFHYPFPHEIITII